MRLVSCFLLAAVLTFSATAQPDTSTPEQLPSVELPPELDRVLRDYEKAWAASDEAALAALFSEDGFILRPGRAPVRGRANIEAAYANSGGPLALRAYAYGIEGNIGYILGGYSGLPGTPDSGKYTLTLHKGDDGHWFIFSDMDNGNR